MKVSDFLTERKIKFVNGVAEVIDKKINGEVIFYDLSNDRIKLINENVVQQLTDKDNDETITYKMFGCLTDIENDVDISTFISMLNVPPCSQFALIKEKFVELFNEFFEIAKTEEKTKNTVNKLTTNLPKQPKTPQQIRKELNQELGTLIENTPENKKRRKEIFMKLADLED